MHCPATFRRVALTGALSALLPFGLAGCTEFASPDDQLTVETDPLEADNANDQSSDSTAPDSEDTADTLTAQGSVGSADWSCLNEPAPDRPFVADPSATHTLSVRVAHLLGGLAQEVELKACAAADLLCASPVAEGLQPDEMGFFHVPVIEGFTGFLEIRANDLFPLIYYISEPVVADRVATYPIIMFPPAALAPLAEVSQVEIRPELTLVAIVVDDCAGVRAPGVEFTNTVGGVPFYFEDSLPSTSGTETDSAGSGGFVNVPPGEVQFGGTLADGTKLPSQRVALRDGFSATVTLRAR